jgi:hypothetical protein
MTAAARLSDLLGENVNEPTFPDTLCGFRRDVHFGAPQIDTHGENLDDVDPDDASQFDAYELGQDVGRDTINCHLHFAWKRFYREATERKWSQLTRNRATSEFAAFLRGRFGRATVEPSYVAAREGWERGRS